MLLRLLDLLGRDTTGYNRAELQFPGLGSPLFFAALLLGGLALFLVLRRPLPLVSRPRRALLALLRGTAVFLVVAVSLQPRVQLQNALRLKNHVALLVDRTASMTLPDEKDGVSRAERAGLLLKESAEWIEKLEKDFVVDRWGFSGTGESFAMGQISRAEMEDGGESAGRSTDISALVEELVKVYADQPFSGTVLFTDGGDTEELGRAGDRSELRKLLRRLEPEKVGAPLSTVALGEVEPFKDLSVARIKADEFGFVRNSVEIEVIVRAKGFGELTVPLTLRRGRELLHTQPVRLREGQEEYRVKISFKPMQVGEFIYTLTLPAMEGEKLTENNKKSFRLKVIRDRIRVLQVVGSPSWDERFVRRMLKRDPNVDLISFFILREAHENPGVRENELSLIPFPTQEVFDKQLPTFDVVILQNFRYNLFFRVTRRHLRNMRDFVVEKGGGFIMLGGSRSFQLGQYRGTPIEEILPVRLTTHMGRTGEDRQINADRFAMELTPAGAVHPITRLHPSAERNREIWAAMPLLDGVNLVGGLMPGGTALGVHPTLKTPGGEPLPVVAVRNVGRGRTMSIATDSTWYWNYLPAAEGGTNRHYYKFWREALRWLIHDPELKLVSASSPRTSYPPGEEATIAVEVLDNDYKGLENARIEAEAEPLEGGKREKLVMRSLGGGRYETSFTPSGEGFYRVEVKAGRGREAGGEKEAGEPYEHLGEDTLYLEVLSGRKEFENPRVNRELLKELARRTGGESVAADDGALERISFDNPEVFKILSFKDLPIWDNLFFLLLVVSLFTAEWLLRRRWGGA